MIAKFTFYKEGGKWYVDLPHYPGPKADLEMVAGADDFLDILSSGKAVVSLNVSEESIPSFDEIVKMDKNDIGSGAYYFVARWESKELNQEMWLCDVMLYVFGAFPDRLYIQRSA